MRPTTSHTTKQAALAALALAALALLFGASRASAEISFCPPGEGAGQCGSLELGDSVRGLAADAESGHLYVADEANNRIDVFAQDGSFLFAFGWKVNATTPEEKLQTCTTATGCLKGSIGTGAGQFRRPINIAVDNDPASPSHHDVYVGEAGNFQGAGGDFRFQKFDPNGAFVWMAGKAVDKTDGGDLCTEAEAHTCGAGIESSAEGGFSSRVLLATGPAGVLYAVDAIEVGETITQRLQRFQPSGALIPSQASLVEGHLIGVKGVAVDAAGNLWVTGQDTGLSKYSPTGTPLAGPFESAVSFQPGLTINAGGTIFATQFEAPFSAITAYDPATGTLLRRFAYTEAGAGLSNLINGLTAHTSAFGEFFFSQMRSGITYTSEPPPGPVIADPSVKAKSIGNVRATLTAEVNPEGKASEAHFDYVDEATYLKDIAELGPGHGFDHAKSSETAPLGAEGFSLKAAEALAGCPEASKALIEEGKCLRPETKYRFRAITTNPDGEGNSPIEGEPFTTRAPLEFGDTYATGVGTDTAVLHAEVNPLGIPTTAHFEYVDDATFQASGFAEAIELPNVGEGAAPLDYGKGEAITDRAATAFPLTPATTYHYRLIATDPLLEAPLSGPEHSFTTPQAAQGQSCPNEASRIGFGALLPDCRAYEMVSPIDKDGGDIRVLATPNNVPAVLEQSSDSGERLAYGSIRSFGDAASAPFTSQYIAQRVEGQQWQTHSIDPPRGRALVLASAQFNTEFKAFSPDLCDTWQITYAEPPLAGGSLPGYRNLYRRSDRLCGVEGYEALAPIAAPGISPSDPDPFEIILQGISADGADAIFTEGNTAGVPRHLYESTGSTPPHLVCVLPDGAALSGTCTAGSVSDGEFPSPQSRPISADGSRVFWSDRGNGQGKIYLRQNPAAAESARLHGAASGKGTLIGPATGTGNVSGEFAKGVKVGSGGFAVGQEISDSAGKIPANTTIVNVEETAPATFTLTLSAKASGVKPGDFLTGAASEEVPALLAETGAFEAGQEISAPGIPPGTTVLACSPSCGPGATSLTLSAKATKTEIGAPLAATSPCTEAQTKACTIAVSKAGEDESGTSESWFWGATRDGSEAIFTTGELDSGKATLYRFEANGEATTPIAQGVVGVMGISEDANRIYFGSSEVLSGEETNNNGDKAQAGNLNLYLYEADEGGGTTRFIATLADADREELGFAPNSSNSILGYRTTSARISSDGALAAFVSVAALTGYDNKASRNGEGFLQVYARGDDLSEVYLYDAAAHKLICASCNPSGSRPAGPSSIPRWETGMHAARVLTDDRPRVYFESADALLPRDANGKVDVYQWEAPGAGSCTEASPTYSAQDEGCIDLISSGQSHIDSRFVEADPSGKNVFIATASGLLPQDPGGVDIYDARVEGGLPIPQGPPPGCEGEACQSPPEAPNDPTPASSSFHGAGNVVEEPQAGRCAKSKVRRKGRCVAKHHKRAKHRQARKANRNRRAAR